MVNLHLQLSVLGWVHTAASVIAIVTFVVVMLSRKGSRRHRASGRVYAAAYVVVCATSLGLYSGQGFWFPHWLAVAGLAVLTAGYLAARLKPRGWRYLHLSAMLLSAYNLFGGGVNEAFLRIEPLRARAGPNIFASPLVGMTHAVVMLAFTLLIVLYVTATVLRSSRRGRISPSPSGIVE